MFLYAEEMNKVGKKQFFLVASLSVGKQFMNLSGKMVFFLMHG